MKKNSLEHMKLLRPLLRGSLRTSVSGNRLYVAPHEAGEKPRSGGRDGWDTYTMRFCRILGLSVAAVLLSACGVLGGGGAAATPAPAAATTGAPATTAPSPAARATASPIPSPVAKPSAPAAEPAAAPAPAQANTVWVGNTDGQGVYVRNTPVMADRAKAYPDGTSLTIIGDDVDGDGQHWKHVKTPDGLEGYVPAIYTVDTPP